MNIQAAIKEHVTIASSEACLEFPRQNSTSVDVARIRLKTLAVTKDLCRRRSWHWCHQQTVAYTIPVAIPNVQLLTSHLQQCTSSSYIPVALPNVQLVISHLVIHLQQCKSANYIHCLAVYTCSSSIHPVIYHTDNTTQPRVYDTTPS